MLWCCDPMFHRCEGRPQFASSSLPLSTPVSEMGPLRVDIVGEVAYEAGRCKMLVPTAVGKRREERGKYLVVFARQATAEWKMIADCWSSDLSLKLGAESEVTKPVSPIANPK